MKWRTKALQPRPFSFASRQNRRHSPRSCSQVVADPTQIPHERFRLILDNQHQIDVTLLVSITSRLRPVQQQTADRIRITRPDRSNVLLEPQPLLRMPVLNTTRQRWIRVRSHRCGHVRRSSTQHVHATSRRASTQPPPVPRLPIEKGHERPPRPRPRKCYDCGSPPPTSAAPAAAGRASAPPRPRRPPGTEPGGAAPACRRCRPHS